MIKSKNATPVFLLCGGKGDRLKPLTETRPKPLVEIKGRPILDYILRHFTKAGFTKFVIAVGYKAEMIQSYVKKEHPSLDIQLVDSGDVDIVKRLSDAAPYLTDDFILSYGDTLADVDLDALLKFHDSHSGKITVTTYPLRSPFGLMEINQEGLVQSFAEKPIIDKWINIGYFRMDRSVLDRDMSRYGNFVDFINDSISRGEMYSLKHRGMHITVNNVKELAEAEDNIDELQKKLGD